MWTIHLPLRVQVTKRKKFSLNLNQYRNTHYQTLNRAKSNFEEMISPLLKDIPKLKNCSLTYTLYPATRRLCDVANVCSIVDKFFSDALVNKGILEDDNYKYVPQVSYTFGSIDRENPRVEVTITPIEEMK